MSVNTLKLLSAIAGMLLLPLFTTECKAQTANANDTTSVKDSIRHNKDSIKKTATAEWSIFKKKIKGEQQIIKKEKDPATSYISKKKSPTKKNGESVRMKTRNNAPSGAHPVNNDSLKQLNKSVRKNLDQKMGSFSTSVSDTMNRDSLKQKASKRFSKKTIENTLQNATPVQDYKLDKESLEQKNVFSTKRKRGNFIIKQKDGLSNHISKIQNPVKKNTDSVKQINVCDIIKKQLTTNLKGSVSVGYEYGILPYATPENYPCGGFKSEGRLSVFLLALPVEVSYRYSTVKSVIGITNFFRISYDVGRYKEELDKKMVIRERLKKINLDKLQEDKQAIAMKMEYFKLSGNMEVPDFSVPDTSMSFTGKWPIDFMDSAQVDSSRLLSFLNKKDSYLKKKNDYSQKKDSLLKFTYECKAQYNEYKAKYDSIMKVIDRITNGAEELKNLKEKDKIKTEPAISKAETFLKNIKKFEIGLCNPSYSLFLLSNAPLKGVNFEYATKEHFFAITYGTTVNTLFYNPNTLQGKIQQAKNFYNFFDFNDLSKGRKVLAIKGGQGQKEDTHFFVGVLFGRGKMDYLTTTDPKFGKKESNIVAEIDGKYKFSESLNAEVILGKSSLQSEDISVNRLKESFKEIFSPYRSNALQAKINYDIRKTKTKIQLTGRLIDPYFKSFGVSFLRSDNIRYEVKADQVITRMIKYSVAYRREEDNLLGLINYKNTFITILNSLNIKLKKGLSLRLNYAPLLRTLRNGDELKKDKNSISTAVLSYVPSMKHIQANYNILYSKYRVTSDSGNIHFDNLTYSHQFQFENGFKTGTNASWFENTLKDTLNNNTYLGMVDVGYTTKEQNSLTIGGKMAVKPGTSTEFGFLAKMTLKVYKTIFWEAEAEKILTGDYYSSWIDAKIRRFPYYLSTKMIINF